MTRRTSKPAWPDYPGALHFFFYSLGFNKSGLSREFHDDYGIDFSGRLNFCTLAIPSTISSVAGYHNEQGVRHDVEAVETIQSWQVPAP